MPRNFDIQLRRNTASLAAADNPILDAGEPGWEKDTGRLKIGDGITPWNMLPYATLVPGLNLSDVQSADSACTNIGAAQDSAVVHLADIETITGNKTLSGMVAVLDKTSATNVALRAQAQDHTIHVSLGSNASDANDGLSAGSAKATVAGALTALGSDPGWIKTGYGTFNITAADSDGNAVTLNQVGTILEGTGHVFTVINVDADVTWGLKAAAGHCTIRDITVQVASGKTVTYGAGVSSTEHGSAEQCVFDNVHVVVEGTNTAMFAVGPDVDADIAQTHFNVCQAVVAGGTATHGWLLGNDAISDTLMCYMSNCGISGPTNGITIDGCGLTWVGGGGTNCGTDINVLAYGGDAVQFYGYRGENGTQALTSSGSSGFGPGVVLDSCFFGNYTGPSSDGVIIAWGGAAPLTIRGGYYATVGNNTSITLNPFSGQYNVLVADGMVTDTANPFPAANPTLYGRFIRGYSYMSGGGGGGPQLFPTGLQFVADGLTATVIGALAAASNLSDLGSASTARTNLGLGSAALLASSAVAQTANSLSDLASPTSARANLGVASPPTGYTIETFERVGASLSAQAIGTTGLQAGAAIYLKAGQVVTNIGFLYSAAGATLTHRFHTLLDPSGNLLAYTADQTSTAPTTNTVAGGSLAVAKNAAGGTISSFTATVTGWHYIGLVVAATTQPTVYGVANQAAAIAPVLAFQDAGHTGLTTTPPAAATLTGLARLLYGGIS